MDKLQKKSLIAQARQRYNLDHWGDGYIDISDSGHLLTRPGGDTDSARVDLYELSQSLKAQGIALPVLVRFMDILDDRVATLRSAFADAMAPHNMIRDNRSRNSYDGSYTAVYPIKVNQQRCVVERIAAHGSGKVGLEAGSKPELMAVLALADAAQGIIICNGYKDREYIRLALIGQQLGHRVYIVVEKLSELELIIKASRELKVEPLLGVRVRLASTGQGKWQNSGGEKAKFGLSAAQVIEMIARLEDVEMLPSLQLLHFHLGSQIANIRDIQRGMQEAARYYAELRGMGAPIRCVDVGGGLGVDYEGARSRSFCSMNYSINEYARHVVHALWQCCEQQQLPHPHIITEAGRAMTAHHAVLITEVIDIERVIDAEQRLVNDEQASIDEPQAIKELRHGLAILDRLPTATRSPIECYHDAAEAVSVAQESYIHGVLTLAQRALAEQLYFAICRRVQLRLSRDKQMHHEILNELNEKLADKYFCNFSLFQSLPDVWAIDQIFPVVPLHRLDETPICRAVIADLTCDSDGRIDHYVDHEGIDTTLSLHSFNPAQPYLLGIFLVGAYQEILGDMHNLFGDTNAINLELDGAGGFQLSEVEAGDTVDEVLRYVHFDSDELLCRYKNKLANTQLDTVQQAAFFDELQAGLAGYTYYEK